MFPYLKLVHWFFFPVPCGQEFGEAYGFQALTFHFPLSSFLVGHLSLVLL